MLGLNSSGPSWKFDRPSSDPIDLAGHGDRECLACVPKDSKVGASENLRTHGEIDAVVRECSPARLPSEALQAVEVHDEATVRLVHVDVRRRDMGSGEFLEERMRQAVPAVSLRTAPLGSLQFFGVHKGQFAWEVRLADLQAARGMDPPRTQQVVSVRKADLAALVIREIRVVPAERFPDPARHPDQRRALDVRTDAGGSAKADDRGIKQALDSHRRLTGLTSAPKATQTAASAASFGALPAARDAAVESGRHTSAPADVSFRRASTGGPAGDQEHSQARCSSVRRARSGAPGRPCQSQCARNRGGPHCLNGPGVG